MYGENITDIIIIRAELARWGFDLAYLDDTPPYIYNLYWDTVYNIRKEENRK